MSKDLDEDHPAVFRISWIGTEAVLALEVAAACVLCGLNIVVSTPAEVMTVRIHLERVSLDTRLYGLVKLTKSLVSVPLRGFVLLRYSFKQVQTQRDGLVGYALKTIVGAL